MQLQHQPAELLTRQRRQQNVIGCQIDVSSVAAACDEIVALVEAKQRGYVCLANVHMCMEAWDQPAFAQVLQEALLVLPDGRPIFWAQRLLGQRQARQVRGLDLVLALCAKAEREGLRMGLFGGKDQELLTQLNMRLLCRFPLLQISYAYAPPFRPLTATETAQQVHAIHQAKVDILLVGLGCPKQELWMAQHQPQVNAVMLGVGAAFDFLAGQKLIAPRWLQQLGLEWMFRLLSEPSRLTGRYLRHNPRFILRFGLQYFRGMMGSTSANKSR